MKTASGTLLFLLLFTRVSSQITEIQRDSRIYAFNVNSNLSFVGHEFRNHQISNFSTKFMATQCAMECHRTSRCQSFNFASKTRQCLLNDATHEDFPEDLANDSSTTGTVYYLKEAISINPVKYLDSVFLVYNEMCYSFETNWRQVLIFYYENLFRQWHYQSQKNNSSPLRHLLYGLVQNTDIFLPFK